MDITKIAKDLHECRQQLKQLKETEKQIAAILHKEFKANGTNYQDIPNMGLKLEAVTSERVSMDEDILINILKDILDKTDDPTTYEVISNCMEYVLKVDEEKVEELIYGGILNAEDIEPALKTKTITQLKFKKL